MFYLYMNSPFGTELLAKSNDRDIIEKIQTDKESKWQPGDMWSTKIVEQEQKETIFVD